MKYAKKYALWCVFGILFSFVLTYIEIFLIEKSVIRGPLEGWAELGNGSRGYVAGVFLWLLVFIIFHIRKDRFIRDFTGICLLNIVIIYAFSFFALLVFVLVPYIFGGLYFAIQYFRDSASKKK